MPGFGISFGLSTLFVSLIILFPLSALLAHVAELSWAQYWRAISDPRVVASYRVTLTGALYSSIAAALIGLLLAWIVTRYEFPGRRIIDALVDLPFALPTAVAGLTLAVLFAPGGWFGQFFAAHDIKIAYAYPGIVIAMTFTSLPFVVRTVQPVLLEGDKECEEAARSLGATAFQTFWRITLPTIVPALVAGTSQAFIRSLGEFGAVIMIAGNMPFRTEVSSLMIFVRLQEFDYPAASAIASVILLASLLMLFVLQLIQGRLFPWQRVMR
ncbi:sulfate ABC transporter permease subunit CysT [Pseudothauera nasutitermitis]|nr:sulfate ABC transporter permease subunit CysT [Pseudothauera nasutitermitis]